MDTSSTSLNLLTRDGAICVTFSPALEPPQYDQLYDLTKSVETQDDLCKVVLALASRWNRQVIIDPC